MVYYGKIVGQTQWTQLLNLIYRTSIWNSFLFCRSEAQTTSLHSVRPPHKSDTVHQTSQEGLNSTDASDITVHYKPPLVREAKPQRSDKVASEVKNRGRFVCPICDNVAMKHRYHFIRHLRSHYRNRTLLRLAATKQNSAWCKTGNKSWPHHAGVSMLLLIID